MNRNIILTGAAGYLASHLIPELINNNYKVYGIDVKEYGSLLDSVQPNDLIFIEGEFGQAKKKIVHLLNKENATISSAIHFAGMSDVAKCNENPVNAYGANVDLTLEVLDFCREHNIRKFYFPSTALVYGEHRNNYSSTEDSLIDPLDFYAWTKYIAEKAVESYCATFGVQATIMRFSSIIGYPFKKGTVLSDIYGQIRNGKKEVIIKDGSPIRDFIFVEDAVSAIISLLKMETNSGFEVYNVSSGIGISALDLARLVCASNDLPVSIVKSQKPREKEPPALVLDNRKLKQAGWSPRYSIKASIKQINRYVV